MLAVGGYDGGDFPLASAELYDPDTGSWTAIASTHFDPRPPCPGCLGGYGWTTLLRDGTLLLMPLGLMLDSSSAFNAEIYDPGTGTWTELAAPSKSGSPVALLSDGTVLITDLIDPSAEFERCTTAAALYDPRTGSSTTASSMLRCGDGSSFTLLLDGTVLQAGGSDCNDGVCVANGAAELYVPAGVSPPPMPAFPIPPPPVFPSPTPEPSPTPRPTPIPPAVGPVPPNAHSWTVTVDNDSSEPATLFVFGDDGMSRLVGSATPNVVPAGATVQVTFLFPDTGDNGHIYVNARPGDGGGLVAGYDIGIPGKIWIREDGEVGWLSP